MKVLASTLGKATKLRSAQGTVQNMSKVMELGNSYRIFIPTVLTDQGAPDILIATVPGRKLNYEKLGRSFIALDDYDVDENDKVTDLSGLQPYSRISRVLFDAARREEIAKTEREAKATADQMGTEIDVVALKQAIREIDLRYNGDRDVKPAIYATENPLISKVTLETATEVVLVPLDTEKKPIWSKAQSAALPISAKKEAQLTSLVHNPDYCDPNAGYLEVSFDYVGTDKKTAGQNAVFQGVSNELSLKNKFPDDWKANSKEVIISRLVKTAEAIASRNMTMSSRTTVKEVIELFNKYVSKHPLILLNIDFESDTTKGVAKDMVDLKVAADVPKVQERLISLVQENGTQEEEQNYEDISKDVISAKGSTTLSELMDKVDGDLDDVTGNDIDEL